QQQKATQNLLAALTLRPTLVLSESEYAPTALAALERARDKVAAAPRAKVTLDGAGSGETPVTLRGITAGRHLLVLQAPGRVALAKWVDVPAAGLQLSFPLAEDPTRALRAELREKVAKGGADEVPQTAAKLAALSSSAVT